MGILVILARKYTMLSNSQEKVFKAIKYFYSAFGYSPSIREIGQLCGMKSSNTVHGHLKVLESKGYIATESSKPRTIKILLE